MVLVFAQCVLEMLNVMDRATFALPLALLTMNAVGSVLPVPATHVVTDQVTFAVLLALLMTSAGGPVPHVLEMLDVIEREGKN